MLKTYIAWLSAENKKLREEYPKVRRVQITVPLLLSVYDIALAIAIIFLDNIDSHLSSRSFLPLFAVVSYILIAIISKKACQPTISKYRDIYRRAQTISDTIVDEADWTNFRKRELWNKRRLQVINTIEEFYSIRNKRFFPYPTVHSYYRYIQKTIVGANSIGWIEMFCVIVFSFDPGAYLSVKEILQKIASI